MEEKNDRIVGRQADELLDSITAQMGNTLLSCALLAIILPKERGLRLRFAAKVKLFRDLEKELLKLLDVIESGKGEG